ncbi:MAG TPA: AraC family transcriptional regulator [Steroidobacteraceae bacterium]|jgi:AraC family transcriptional regulator|nr:AraC family transcriptional regulator [Steroidobacteraceae bacterium]
MSSARSDTQGTQALFPWNEVMQQPPACSSASLGWKGIEAHRYDGLLCRDLRLPASSRHFIAAHLRNPCRIEARWADRTHRGGSHAGCNLLMAAGQESEWNCSDRVDELHIFLDPAVVDEVAAETDRGKVELIDGVGIIEPTIREVSMRLLAEIEQPELGTRLFADTMARSLALELIRRRSTARAPRLPPVYMTARQLKTTTDYIETHLDHDLSLAHLAAAPAMSPFRFARAFKMATGRSPRQYVIARRLERAKELLRSCPREIGDIADMVGFATLSHFSASFRRHCGVSPKRYRESFRS